MGTLVLAFLALFCVGIVEGGIAGSFAVTLVLLLCGLALLTCERKDLPLRVLLGWFIAAYSLRICFSILVHIAASTAQESSFLFKDESTFWGAAHPLLVAWQEGTILQQVPQWYQRDYWAWLHVIGFTRFLGNVLGGDSTLNITLVNCAVGALIVPYVYGIADILCDRHVARVAGTLAFLLPDYWLFSATLLRDAFVSFAIAMILYQVVASFYGRFRWWRPGLALWMTFGVLLYLRTYAAILVVVVVIFCCLWEGLHRLTARRFVLMLVSVFSFVFVVFVVLAAALPKDSYQNPRNMLRMQSLVKRGIDRYTDSAVKKADEDSLGVLFLEVPFYLRVPLSTVRLLLLPIPPWGPLQSEGYSSSTRAFLETLAGCVWYLLMPFLVIGGIGNLLCRRVSAVWICVPTLIFILALAINTGLNPRHRLMGMPFLLILISQGWVLRARYQQWAGLVVLLIVALLASYMVIKYLWPALGVLSLATVIAPASFICVAGRWRWETYGSGSGLIAGGGKNCRNTESSI